MYSVLEYGSTLLNVDNQKSDLDLLVISFDCLHDRRSFFINFDKLLAQNQAVKEVVLVTGANVPVIKFRVGQISVDLTFVECKTPQ